VPKENYGKLYVNFHYAIKRRFKEFRVQTCAVLQIIEFTCFPPEEVAIKRQRAASITGLRIS
jgi:hypothetical protein